LLITVLWIVTPYTLVGRYGCLQEPTASIQSRRWRQQIFLFSWYLSYSLHDVTWKKMVILLYTAIRTSNTTLKSVIVLHYSTNLTVVSFLHLNTVTVTWLPEVVMLRNICDLLCGKRLSIDRFFCVKFCTMFI